MPRPTLLAAAAPAAALLLAACGDPIRPAAAAHRPALRPAGGTDFGSLAPETRITIQDLGVLGTRVDGSESSEAFSINGAGEVTGTSTWPGPAGSPQRVFLWTPAAGMTSGGFYGEGRGPPLAHARRGARAALRQRAGNPGEGDQRARLRRRLVAGRGVPLDPVRLASDAADAGPRLRRGPRERSE